MNMKKTAAEIILEHSGYRVGIISGLNHGAKELMVEAIRYIDNKVRKKTSGVTQTSGSSKINHLPTSPDLIWSVPNTELIQDLLDYGHYGEVTDILRREAENLTHADCDAVTILSPELYFAAPSVTAACGKVKFLHLGDIIGEAVEGIGLAKIGYIGDFRNPSSNVLLSRLERHVKRIYCPSDEEVQELYSILVELRKGVSNISYTMVTMNIIRKMVSEYQLPGIIINSPELRRLIDGSIRNELIRAYSNPNHEFVILDAAHLQMKAIAQFCVTGRLEASGVIPAGPHQNIIGMRPRSGTIIR